MQRAIIIQKSKKLFNRHFEWMAFTGAILAMALMNPYAASGPGWCLIERLGLPCPGDGLGHSIAFIFRGDFQNAIQANILGPFALIVLSGRIFYLIKQRFFSTDKQITLLRSHCSSGFVGFIHRSFSEGGQAINNLVSEFAGRRRRRPNNK